MTNVEKITIQIGFFYYAKAEGKNNSEKAENAIRNLTSVGITKVEYDDKDEVTIHLNSPALLIGKRGSNIDELKESLSKNMSVQIKRINLVEEKINRLLFTFVQVIEEDSWDIDDDDYLAGDKLLKNYLDPSEEYSEEYVTCEDDPDIKVQWKRNVEWAKKVSTDGCKCFGVKLPEGELCSDCDECILRNIGNGCKKCTSEEAATIWLERHAMVKTKDKI